MKMKSIMLLAVAVACGLVTMLGVRKALQKETVEVKKVEMLVAISDILPGEPLNEMNTAFKEITEESIPQGVVTKPEEIEQRALKVRAVPGEPIMLAKLGAEGTVNPSAEIPEGMRVVTVAVNQTKTHSGLIRASDRVDILVTYKKRMEDRSTVNVTKTVLEFIEIYSVDNVRKGSETDQEELKAKNISLLVTPEQAALVNLADTKGDITLSLRNKNDDITTTVADIDEGIFDGAGISKGVREEVASSENEKVDQFLEEEANNNLTVPVDQEVIEEEEIEIPKWTITIGRGENVENIEVVDEEELKRLQDAQELKKQKLLEISTPQQQSTGGVQLFNSAKNWFLRALPTAENVQTNQNESI